MWFEHAMYKEKIHFMFNGELSINNVEFEDFLYHTGSILRIGIRSRNIPKNIPEKWKKREFNALVITLSFGNVTQFECKGGGVGFNCSPVISSKPEEITLLIENKDFHLQCVAGFMIIDDVSPYLDERWD
ncbi:hypothetical protein CE143_16125 [Photorhabdus luminescens]|uniref:Immunity protein 50 n=1 Tax=Photorhabdus akhurstii TaxID=171438 RepID=A0ABX8M232_9GAMM|nr:Imm50 family immunity protein [Photorhabdus akhurstii]QXF34509.1 hypothetical protein B0X70_16135 [Photorhabdus akhurstii]UJD76334.1 hypothetical protein CE143_16125 [Photorhabdus luminescens]